MSWSRDRAAERLATWFGCGRSPLAPGTVGTLGALPCYWLLRHLPGPLYLATWCGLLGLGVWASGRVAELDRCNDPERVVIDEVTGVLLALLLVRRSGLGTKVASLLLFRLLDIVKPGPLRSAERLRPPGVGIMVDDVLAGLAAGLIARGLAR